MYVSTSKSLLTLLQESRKTKTFSIMRTKLLALFSVLFFSVSVFAYDFTVDGIYYNKLGETRVAVTSGDNGYTGDVVIPTSVEWETATYAVVEIGKEAFAVCKDLTSISFGDSVKTIKEGAFYQCSGLTTLSLGKNVSLVEIGAFGYCSSLESITVDAENPVYLCAGNCLIERETRQIVLGIKTSTIPEDESATTIGMYSFYTSDIPTLTIPEAITTIEDCAFGYCNALTSVVLGDGVRSIGKMAFAGAENLEEVVFGNRVETIGEYAFNICKLKTVTLPNSVTTIVEKAFSECAELTTITIGSGVQSIGSRAFAWCEKVETITILATVPPVIEQETFKNIPESAILYVPAGSLEAYKAAELWSQFAKIEAIADENPITALTLKTDRVTINPGDKYYLNSIIEPADANLANLVWSSDNEEVATVEDGLVIAHAEGKAKITLSTLDSQLSAQCDIIVAEAGENGENNVVIDPSSESVNFSWPAVEEAASYVFVIYADAEQTEKICTLTFDDQGYLTRIDFLHKPSATRAAQRGFNFVVTGLEENTTYTYTLDSYNSENEVIERKAGQFTTTSNITTELETPYAGSELSPQKVFENGTIYIVRDGEKYTVDGIRVM